MIAACILTFLTGAVLAWRFQVWILLPATVGAFFAAFFVGMVLANGFIAAASAGIAVSITAQFGYAFGLLVRFGLLEVRAPRGATDDLVPSTDSIKSRSN